MDSTSAKRDGCSSHPASTCKDGWCPIHTERGASLFKRAASLLRDKRLHVCDCRFHGGCVCNKDDPLTRFGKHGG